MRRCSNISGVSLSRSSGLIPLYGLVAFDLPAALVALLVRDSASFCILVFGGIMFSYRQKKVSIDVIVGEAGVYYVKWLS